MHRNYNVTDVLTARSSSYRQPDRATAMAVSCRFLTPEARVRFQSWDLWQRK
jgi:hypothetical protein